jgi:hypothetical protein
LDLVELADWFGLLFFDVVLFATGSGFRGCGSSLSMEILSLELLV